MEFLDTPNKIKKLRKQLSMKQYELASEDLTAAFISMIELGKRGVTRNTAEKIADKLKQKAASMGITLDINGAYLLLSPEEEAEKYCLDRLKEAKTIEEAKQLIPICEKYKLEGPESKIQRFIGDELFGERKYEEAFEAYSYAIDLCKNTDERDMQPYLYNRSGHCKFNLVRYREALFYFDRATYHARIYDNSEILQRALYNSAACHYYLEEFEIVLEMLPDFFKVADKEKFPDPYVRALILKGNCYASIGELDEAIGAYNLTLSEEQYLTPHLKGKIYTNIAGVYLKKGNYVQSLDYFNKAQRIRSEHDKVGLSNTMVEKAQIYYQQGFYEDAIIMIELALETAKQYENRECLIDGYKALEEIYIKIEDKERLKTVYENLMQVLKQSENEKELLRVTNALAFMYLKDKNPEAAEACLEIVQEVYGKTLNNVV